MRAAIVDDGTVVSVIVLPDGDPDGMAGRLGAIPLGPGVRAGPGWGYDDGQFIAPPEPDPPDPDPGPTLEERVAALEAAVSSGQPLEAPQRHQ